MAFLCILVPCETARILSEIDVPGEKESVGPYHCTLFYYGKKVSIDALIKIIKVTYEVLQDTTPFSIKTNKITCFPEGPDGIPIICPIKSNELMELREKIKKAYGKNKIEFNNKFPIYSPHVCLSYEKDEKKAKSAEQKINTLEWGAHQVTLIGGDHDGKDNLIVHFPISLTESEKRKKSFLELLTRIKYA
jgi:hypothetical protein